MENLINKNWITGSGSQLSLDKVINSLKPEIFKGNSIFIGSDSFIFQKKISFVTVVCLLQKSKGGKYFFYKEKIFKYPDKQWRI